MKTNYHKKMALKREGPFEIEEVLGPVTYQLKLPTTWKIHNVFHAVLLKPYEDLPTSIAYFARKRSIGLRGHATP
jgi:hypothetical protein